MTNKDSINSHRRGIYHIFKRFADIIFSLLIILGVLSWMIPLFYLICLVKGKKLFFVQERTGYKNQTFRCIKFRTLDIPPSDEPVCVSTAPMSGFASFIRKTNIDELPQFFNVLIGDMSVSGPRPHMLFHTEKYRNILPEYMNRHLVKPGISGLAQARGFRGEITHDSEMRARLKADLIYIRKLSFLTDLYIFCESIRVLSITFLRSLKEAI